MRPRRRTLLEAIAGVGVAATGVGYWQRRRLRRRDDLAAIRSALAVERPGIEPALSVTTDHVAASHDRTVAHVDETARGYRAREGPDTDSDPMLDRARERLRGHDPAALETDAARLEALDGYLLTVALSATARGRLYEDGDRAHPSDELRDRIAGLETDLNAFDPPYRGSSLSEAIVRCAAVDDHHHRARSDLDSGRRFAEGAQYSNSVAWEQIEVGAARLHDARRFAASTGEDRTAELESAFDRLSSRVERVLDDFEVAYDDEHASYAYTRYVDHLRPASGMSPDDHVNAGRLAAAVRARAGEAVVVSTLDRFTDVPAEGHWEALEFELPAAPDEIPNGKRVAVDRTESTADAVGSNPLARFLLAGALDGVERADRALERLAEDPNDRTGRRWMTNRDQAILRYRAAAAEAETIAEVLKLAGGAPGDS